MDNFGNPKKPAFFCEKCNFKTGNKKDFLRHVLTLKHAKGMKMAIHENGNIQHKKKQIHESFDCTLCGKKYAHYSSLWKHKKKCINIHFETEYDKLVHNVVDTSVTIISKQNKKDNKINQITPTDQSFECGECGKKYAHYCSLWKHKKKMYKKKGFFVQCS